MYRNKLITLLVLVGSLFLVYTASVVFDPERMAERSDSFRLLDDGAVATANRIELSEKAERTILEKRGGRWTVVRDGTAFPAKGYRVEDLLAVLSSRAVFPRKSSTSAAHQALGLTEGAASRIVVFAAAEKPLLDLLVGDSDAAGKNVALRYSGNDESFSGADRFSSYLSGGKRAWFDLALFASDPFPAESIQRIVVRSDLPAKDAAPKVSAPKVSASYTLARDAEKGWLLEGKAAKVDTTKADAYAKLLASAEADDYGGAKDEIGAVVASIVIETGDGRTRRTEIGRSGADGQSDAAVTGAPYRFKLGDWNVGRLVRDEAHFYSAP